MASPISSRIFGVLPAGQTVEAWTLTGRGGLVLEAITYGGIVTRLLAPAHDGRAVDVVLGFNDFDSYLGGHPYFGAITGRVAGRIANAAFTLDGDTYWLARNDPPHHLHGGLTGFDKRLWSAAPVHREDGAPSLRLKYMSPDGEEGYPGNVQVAVTYTVTDDNRFLIETEAVIGIGSWNRIRHLRLNRPMESLTNLRIKLGYPLSVAASKTVIKVNLASGHQIRVFDGKRCIAYRQERPRLDTEAL